MRAMVLHRFDGTKMYEVQDTQAGQIEPIAVNARQAAKLLGLCDRTVLRLAKDGKIPSVKVGTRVIFSIQALREWAAKPQQIEVVDG